MKKISVLYLLPSCTSCPSWYENSANRGELHIAHGSRRMASNDKVLEVTREFDQQEHGFDKVGCAFLELDDPSIPQGLINAIEKGVNEIIVLPYFLSAGRHIAEDITNDVAYVREKHPEINIKIAPYLIASATMTEILLDQARNI